MKESVGYTVTLNIIIIFITIVIAFLCAALIYFKSNKVSNIITSEIENHEGYNLSAINEISKKLKILGYGSRYISCDPSVAQYATGTTAYCYLTDNVEGQGTNGYCVYKCNDGSYDYYKIRTNMMINIPIINEILNIPIYSNTNRLYKFEESKKCKKQGGCFVNGYCNLNC